MGANEMRSDLLVAEARKPVECPKCGHVRDLRSDCPAWQCPACGMAYHKYRTYLERTLERTRASVAPRTVETGLPRLAADTSIWSLLLVNAIALVVAMGGGWHLADLMAVYWIQSVMIGISYFFRIMGLERFSTENFKINNRSVDPTPETKRQTAFFFLMHYGGFHVGYLFFIASEIPTGLVVGPGLVVCGLAFAVNHYLSYRYGKSTAAEPPTSARSCSRRTSGSCPCT